MGAANAAIRMPASFDAPIPGLLTSDEAAQFLAVSPRTLWSLTKNGSVSRVRIGKLVRYDPRDLRAFIDNHKSGGLESAARKPMSKRPGPSA